MQRRAFLAATGVAATAALAGCSGGDSDDNGGDDGSGDGTDADGGDDGSGEDDGNSPPDYDAQAAVEVLRSYITAPDIETARSYLHTSSPVEPSTVGEVVEQSYTVLEENVSRERAGELLGSLPDMTEADIDAVAEGVVVVIEGDLLFELQGTETEDIQNWVVAREGGEWKVVARAVGLD
jgi:hypothetical protein